jgi:hypothetical protein
MKATVQQGTTRCCLDSGSKAASFSVKYLFRSILGLALCSLGVGCASTSTPTPVPVEVKVPVPVPCKVSVPTPPVFAVDALPLGAGIWDQMLALRAERLQRKGYEAVLITTIEACQ